MYQILLIYEGYINNAGISGHISIGNTKTMAEIIYRATKGY